MIIITIKIIILSCWRLQFACHEIRYAEIIIVVSFCCGLRTFTLIAPYPPHVVAMGSAILIRPGPKYRVYHFKTFYIYNTYCVYKTHVAIKTESTYLWVCTTYISIISTGMLRIVLSLFWLSVSLYCHSNNGAILVRVLTG